MFTKEFIQQFLEEAKPLLKDLVREVLDGEPDRSAVLSVDYEEAGRMIGTTYEGIRKMVRNGDLVPVKRGRRRAIAVAELKRFVETSRN